MNGHKFTLPDGFTIEVVAASPLVDRPITADFDERGRLYVSDSSGSNDPVQKQLEERPHRIVRLTDSDGDGTFDQSVVFADRMMFPEGTMWYDGSLYVAAPPSIWKLTDTDDDGVAYGGGLELHETPDGLVLAHGGSWYGYSAAIQMHPDSGLAVAVLCNIDDLDAEDLAQQVAAIWS